MPVIEWWDKFILARESYERADTPVTNEELVGGVSDPKYREITHLIEHPIAKPPPGQFWLGLPPGSGRPHGI